jgi:hypothetical protein
MVSGKSELNELATKLNISERQATEDLVSLGLLWDATLVIVPSITKEQASDMLMGIVKTYLELRNTDILNGMSGAIVMELLIPLCVERSSPLKVKFPNLQSMFNSEEMVMKTLNGNRESRERASLLTKAG